MALTTNELSVLKAHALTIPEMVTAVSVGDDQAIADYFNTLTSIYAWRSYIPPEEYTEVIEWDETAALTTGRARVWEWITSNQTKPLDASKVNVRSGLAKAFQGSQAAATRNGLLGIATRLMTLAESLLVVNDGSAGTTTDGKTMTFEGTISVRDASGIRVYGD